MSDSDFLIVGSGLAGLSAALHAVEFGSVRVVTKRQIRDSNSILAQSGIAAVWDPEDSFEQHVQDTLKSGVQLCRRDAVEVAVREGPARAQELIEFGTQFSRRPDGSYSLYREGGHECRRVLNADDVSGAEIMRAVIATARAHPDIQLDEHHFLIDLVRSDDGSVIGGEILDLNSGQVELHACGAVILATGGAGRLYQYTSNPVGATGDGVAIALRAGARVANLEFVQFHPTKFYHPTARILLTEALRGEGARLLSKDGRRIFDGRDPRGDLAPRDVVTRAIYEEMNEHELTHVWLDSTMVDPAHFPNTTRRLAEAGIAISETPIPVVPAAHYFCGGVDTDLHGRTSVPGLYAVGEVACSGVHGANRLAGNSLLEGVVFARRAVEHIAVEGTHRARHTLPENASEARQASPDAVAEAEALIDEVRALMWDRVGIMRRPADLLAAQRRLQEMRHSSCVREAGSCGELVLQELRNMVIVAQAVVASALSRRESRGGHLRFDHPELDPAQSVDTLLEPAFGSPSDQELRLVQRGER